MKKSVAIALAASAFICGVLTIVSLASPDWVNYTVNGQKVEIGLFEICAPIAGCLDGKFDLSSILSEKRKQRHLAVFDSSCHLPPVYHRRWRLNTVFFTLNVKQTISCKYQFQELNVFGLNRTGIEPNNG